MKIRFPYQIKVIPMKANIFKVVPIIFLLLCGSYGYSSTKVKLRLGASYYHEMGADPMIKLKTRAKIDGKTVPISELEIKVFRAYGDTTFFLSAIKTDDEGIANYALDDDQFELRDTSGYFTYIFIVENHDNFKDVEKSLSFIPAELALEIKQIGETPHIYAKLYNSITQEPVVDEGLVFAVDRLFKPLVIGEEEIYFTDEDGLVLLPYEGDLPGKDGLLTFLVKLDDSDDYGTVLASIDAKLGTNIVLESTYDQRTMWSPPNKTPWMLIIFPNLIILVVWGTLVWLLFNLYKIYKN